MSFQYRNNNGYSLNGVSGASNGKNQTVFTIKPVPQPGSQGNHFGGGHGPRWKGGGVNQSSHYMSNSDGVPVASVNITVNSGSGGGRPVGRPSDRGRDRLKEQQRGKDGRPPRNVTNASLGQPVRVQQGHTGNRVRVPQRPVVQPVVVPQGHTGRSVRASSGGLFVGGPVGVPVVGGPVVVPVGVGPGITVIGDGGVPVGVVPVATSGATIQYGNGPIYGFGL